MRLEPREATARCKFLARRSRTARTKHVKATAMRYAGHYERPEEDVEAEITHLLQGLVYSVAFRHVVEENQQAVRSLEKMQQRVWAREDAEWRKQHRSRFGNHSGRRQQIRDVHVGQTSNGTSSSRRRRPADSYISDGKSSLLGEYPDHARGCGSSCSPSSIAAGAAAAAAAVRVASKDRPWALVQAVCSPSFASHAEALLPSTPPRSQFVFEVEKPINVYAPVDKQKQGIQRRLSMLNALQQETVKLERKARLDARSAHIPSCFYKTLHAQHLDGSESSVMAQVSKR